MTTNPPAAAPGARTRRLPAGVAVLAIGSLILLVRPEPVAATNGEGGAHEQGSSSSSSSSGGGGRRWVPAKPQKPERQPVARPETNDDDDNDDDELDEEGRDAAERKARARVVPLAASASRGEPAPRESELTRARKVLLDVERDRLPEKLREHVDALERHLETEAARFRDLERASVGRLEGTLAQQMLDLFAAERLLGAAEDPAAAIEKFRTAFATNDVAALDELLEARGNELLEQQREKQAELTRLGGATPPLVLVGDLADLEDALRATWSLRTHARIHRSIEDKVGKDEVAKAYLEHTRRALGTLAAAVHDEHAAAASGSREVSSAWDRVDRARMYQSSGANAAVLRLRIDPESKTISTPTADRPATHAFKPEGHLDNPEYMERVGIRNSPTMRLAMRQVAFYRVAVQLGLADLVPRTEYARIGGVHGALQEWARGSTPLERTAVELRRGDPRFDEFNRALTTVEGNWQPAPNAQERRDAKDQVEKYKLRLDRIRSDVILMAGPEHLSVAGQGALGDPHVRLALQRAEILDQLCGQIDRHSYNMLVVGDGSEAAPWRLKLIDNDQAFGHREIAWQRPVASQTPEPTVVDRELANRILALDPDTLATATVGLLTTSEQAALKTRLQQLEELIRELDGAGRVLHPAEVSDPRGPKGGDAAFALDRDSYTGRIERYSPLPPPFPFEDDDDEN